MANVNTIDKTGSNYSKDSTSTKPVSLEERLKTDQAKEMAAADYATERAAAEKQQTDQAREKLNSENVAKSKTRVRRSAENKSSGEELLVQQPNQVPVVAAPPLQLSMGTVEGQIKQKIEGLQTGILSELTSLVSQHGGQGAIDMMAAAAGIKPQQMAGKLSEILDLDPAHMINAQLSVPDLKALDALGQAVHAYQSPGTTENIDARGLNTAAKNPLHNTDALDQAALQSQQAKGLKDDARLSRVTDSRLLTEADSSQAVMHQAQAHAGGAVNMESQVTQNNRQVLDLNARVQDYQAFLQTSAYASSNNQIYFRFPFRPPGQKDRSSLVTGVISEGGKTEVSSKNAAVVAAIKDSLEQNPRPGFTVKDDAGTA